MRRNSPESEKSGLDQVERSAESRSERGRFQSPRTYLGNYVKGGKVAETRLSRSLSEGKGEGRTQGEGRRTVLENYVDRLEDLQHGERCRN